MKTKVHVKIGTMPAEWVHVKGRNKHPFKADSRVYVRRDKHDKWMYCNVDMIDYVGRWFYRLSLV